MLPFIGSAAIVIAALTSTPTPTAPAAAQAATVAAPVTVATPSRRRRHNQQAGVAQPGAPSSDDQAIEEQMRMRVLMPALSGDGGG